MTNFLLKFFYFSVVLLALSGCALTPGGHLNLKDKHIEDTGEPYDMSKVSVYPITPSLIKTLSHKEKQKITPVWQSAVNQPSSDYKIGINDVLAISLWNNPEFIQSKQSDTTPKLRVNNSGFIHYPYVGNIQVKNLSTEEVRTLLTRKLARYLKDPQINVSVIQFESKKIYVTGEVQKPGVQIIKNSPITVLDAINNAGGTTKTARWNAVTLHRDGQNISVPISQLLQKGNLAYNYILQNADVLNIPSNENDNVYLMGEVMQPQTLKISRHGLNLTQALSNAGGINENRADPKGVFVIRQQESKDTQTMANVYQLSIRDATAFALGKQFNLHSGDVVYVTAAPISRWNRVIQNIMPTVGAVNAIDNLSE